MSNKRHSGKKSRAASLSPTHSSNPSQDHLEVIRSLEAKLKQKDDTITELKGRLTKQASLLEHRLQCVERLQKERDELRRKNSSLVGKNAELSRKQSVGNFSTPGAPSRRPSRISSGSRPSLPPTPSSPQPSPKSTPPTGRHPLTSSLSKDLPDKNGKSTKFIIPATENSDTDYSDMEDEEVPSGKSKEDQLSDSIEVLESDILQEIEAVMRTASGTSLTNEIGTKARSNSHPDNLSNGQMRSPGRSSAIPIRSSSKEQNGSPNSTSYSVPNRSQMQRETNSSKPKSTGSGAIAQQIQLFIKKSSESNIETPPPTTSSPKKGSPLVVTNAESQASITSNGFSRLAESDVLSSSECNTTDVESSVDFTSPPLSPSSLEKSTTETETKTEISKTNRARFFDAKLDETAENDEDDTFGDLRQDKDYSMRSRTHTLAAINNPRGKRPMERGRRKLKELKKEARKEQPLKRQSSLTNIHLARNFEDSVLISPEIEAWMRGKIISDLEKKYGGVEKARKAAVTIQRAYREYKLNSRFKEIRKGKRLRAQSMRVPGRRPSILQKQRPMKYRREQSACDTCDPVLKAREAARLLSKERMSHSHSGARLDLVHKQRKESEGKVSEVVEVVYQVDLESGLTLDPQDIVVNIEGVCDEESSTDPITSDKPDGLTPAYSEGDVRPVSIFSTGSSVVSSVSFQEAEGTSSLPVSRPKQFRSRRFSMDTTNQKKNIGVNHFNRKPTRGIQYLVMSNILEDDPRCVAEFLIGPFELSKVKIGEFLGEINSDFNMAVLECLVEHMEMGSKPIDEALRQFQQIFRMPGEAQKIDKIMEVFAVEYYKGNKDVGSIRSEDAAYMLSFAIMMLHTSLHNPSVRSRITRKQWVTMNRGCNEGENFPETMLLDIYDRLQTNEFTTGTDHTDEVMKIEKQIVGSTVPKLANPQRRFLHKLSINEVPDLNSKPSSFSRTRHRRSLFMFSDLVIICKQRRAEYVFKDSFSLLNLMAVSFDSQHYKHGVQLHSSIEDKIVLQCNCDSSQDRDQLLLTLENAISELNMMESERIAELGTSLAAKPKPGQDKHLSGGSVKHRLNTDVGDLLSSTNVSYGVPTAEDHSDFVPGVGDLAVNTGPYLRDAHPPNTRENRSSGDSGFDSQQPTPSPSPTEGTRFHTPSPSPSPTANTYLTPNPSLTSSPAHTTYLTPNQPPTSSPSHTTYLTPNPSLTSSPVHSTHLTPTTNITPPPRSKSSDAIRSLTIIPSPTPSTQNRSPSVDLYRHRGSSEASSDKKVKKGTPKRESSKKKGFFSFGRNKGGNLSPVKRRGSASPPVYRDFQQSLDISSNSVEIRGRSSSSVDLTRTT